jgi:hypothetical protein
MHIACKIQHPVTITVTNEKSTKTPNLSLLFLAVAARKIPWLFAALKANNLNE